MERAIARQFPDGFMGPEGLEIACISPMKNQEGATFCKKFPANSLQEGIRASGISPDFSLKIATVH
jgi:hypothetical protein